MTQVVGCGYKFKGVSFSPNIKYIISVALIPAEVSDSMVMFWADTDPKPLSDEIKRFILKELASKN